MASLIRDLTIEQGIDPREFTLLPFGGAGPMMATEIARELGIRSILIPPHAGNFSAWGLLGADLLRSRARTRVMILSPAAIAAANAILDEMVPLLMITDQVGKHDLEESLAITLDMRFAGQEHTLSVSPAHREGCISSSVAEIESLFKAEYVRSYGAALEGTIEIVNIRAARRRALPRRVERYEYRREGAWHEGTYFSFAERRRMGFKTLHRGDLEPGARYAGTRHRL